ncbi:DUF1905 domain-containing protein [Flavobacterium ovatum]|uniref:DUF1905 domain-containing protein n=1 Tax=Flavobacterium ovatum TaxID=1928857 RepID=UPI00344F76AF
MSTETIDTFWAKIEIIGINPFVFVPESILNTLFENSGKSKGAIPIKGSVNDVPYLQNLVKYSGEWRLYINAKMLKNSPKRIGEQIQISITYDPEIRTLSIHPKLAHALGENVVAFKVFQNLRPSLQQEIILYIFNLKTESSVDNNVQKAIAYLLGKGRFVGREIK